MTLPEAGPLGVFGGTFDPIHYGHLRLAETAREALGLTRVRLIPAGQPPHRATPGAAGAHHDHVCIHAPNCPSWPPPTTSIDGFVRQTHEAPTVW